VFKSSKIKKVAAWNKLLEAELGSFVCGTDPFAVEEGTEGSGSSGYGFGQG
jgi:hypothetical protein